MDFVKINHRAKKENISVFEAKRFGVSLQTPKRFFYSPRRFLNKSNFD
jgi:hypothetical protein